MSDRQILFADFEAVLNRWIADDWVGVTRARKMLLLVATVADEICEHGDSKRGPAFAFVFDHHTVAWSESAGGWWREMDASRILDAVASRWAAGTLPEVPR